MVEHQGGLRFDIYERVHLSEGVAGIKELENVELVPHIQVLPQGEQALLRGNLLLSGTYVDEEDAENRSLEHLIPVEITLPMNRVQRVEDIAVEIENFDVDLLSTRSLNITGVLSLNGLEAVSSSFGERWGEAEEEVVFVHEAQAGAPPQLPVNEAYEGQSARVEFPLEEETPVSGSPEDAALQEEAEAVWNPENSVAGIEPLNQPVSDPDPQPEDKKEMKIAFSGKRPQEKPAAPSNGISALLPGSQTGKSDARNQEKQEPEAPAAAAKPGGKLEWKKLLLSSMNDKQEFKRVRLCIVQKEETLETIAKRYELNPREIALFNRLGDSDLSEGQIVYIPK